jgi:hypothetical protein
MEKQFRIEQYVQMTLDALDHPESLPPRPGLYDRIRHRLEARSSGRSPIHWHLKPVLLAVLVLLNLSIAYWYFVGGGRSHGPDSKQELIEILSGDLNIPGSNQPVLQ